MRYLYGFVVGGTMVASAFFMGMIGGYAIGKCAYEPKENSKEE